jgi:hypothetical protein
MVRSDHRSGRRAEWIAMEPLVATPDELNARREWFEDPARAAEDGPFVVVQDDFHPDPSKIRELALQQRFLQYSPPLAEQVGEEVARQHPDPRPAYFSSALLRYWGVVVRTPQPGFRYAPPELRDRIAVLLGEKVRADTWEEMGDWWNGAFHVKLANWVRNRSAIHHHFKAGDVTPRGWSGLVYLSPEAPRDSGTTIWRERRTGLCVAGEGAKFSRNVGDFELALRVENRFNRLVLFRENVLHRSERGFGTSIGNGRLTQTFFFHADG